MSLINGSDNELAHVRHKGSDLKNVAIYLSNHHRSFVNFRVQNKPALQISIYLLSYSQMKVYPFLKVLEDVKIYVWGGQLHSKSETSFSECMMPSQSSVKYIYM